MGRDGRGPLGPKPSSHSSHNGSQMWRLAGQAGELAGASGASKQLQVEEEARGHGRSRPGAAGRATPPLPSLRPHAGREGPPQDHRPSTGLPQVPEGASWAGRGFSLPSGL